MKPEEKQNNIIRTAQEIMKRSGTGEEPAITFDQALKIIQLEQICRIASNSNSIRVAVDNLTEEITEDISGSMILIHNRLNEIDQTLCDTLGSAKTGAALDALAELPKILKDK